MKIDNVLHKINNKYSYILRGKQYPNQHLFMESYEWFAKSFLSNNEGYTKEEIKKYDPTNMFSYNNKELDISKIKSLTKCKYQPKKIISEKKLNELYEFTRKQNIRDITDIKNELDKLLDYNLPSTIPNLNKFKSKTTKPKTLNILIAGAGPVGLFNALYLHHTYNLNPISDTYVNILVVDNRIAKEGIKLPYSRTTQFGFDLSIFQEFIKQIFCWEDKKCSWAINPKCTDARHFDYIIFLENLLFLTAHYLKIPMFFTKKIETFDKLKQFANHQNIDFIFDCSGGRLKANFKNNIFVKTNYKFTKGKYNITLHNNLYRLHINKKLYTQTNFVIQLLDYKYKPLLFGNIFSLNYNSEDEKLVQFCSNKCFTIKKYIDISQHFRDNKIRYLLPYIMYEYGYGFNKIKYIKVTPFDSSSRHLPYCAIKINNKMSYIALGDTLGNSDFGIKFGMNASVLLSKYICNSISMI